MWIRIVMHLKCMKMRAGAKTAMKACITKTMCGLVRAYQLLVGPVLPPSCRYYPSCSNYAIEALHRHGPVAGLWLAVRRILRCQPWGGDGVDPVPERIHMSPPVHSHTEMKS
jgi:putative membrane protein insertion efficiency factor